MAQRVPRPLPEAAMTEAPPGAAAARECDVAIVGGGFAGLACAQALGRSGLTVIVVDRRNHHLFQPLLYQVATAALSPADIAQPIRSILADHRNIEVLMGEVESVAAEQRMLRIQGGLAIRYRALVLATGSDYSYFGHDEWSRFAPGLKTLEDARAIRSTLLRNFELAEASDEPLRRRALMTTLIIGGGPTGVEMAGAIAELARWTLAGDFRRIDPKDATVTLVEAGPRLLASFPEPLAAYAARELERLGVTLRLGQPVEEIEPGGALIAGQRVEAGLVIWAAGVRASPAARWLDVPADRGGRIAVAPDLSVPGRANVFALGDIAALAQDGKPLPALAQVAKQQGRHLGEALPAFLGEGRPPPPFRFHDRGNAAVIGRHAAVFDFGGRLFKGRLAWLLWALVHVALLVGLERKVLVLTQWIWRYFTYRRGARLIR
jgi:NADH:ubiquinone reductase (H+-translocating)